VMHSLLPRHAWSLRRALAIQASTTGSCFVDEKPVVEVIRTWPTSGLDCCSCDAGGAVVARAGEGRSASVWRVYSKNAMQTEQSSTSRWKGSQRTSSRGLVHGELSMDHRHSHGFDAHVVDEIVLPYAQRLIAINLIAERERSSSTRRRFQRFLLHSSPARIMRMSLWRGWCCRSRSQPPVRLAVVNVGLRGSLYSPATGRWRSWPSRPTSG